MRPKRRRSVIEHELMNVSAKFQGLTPRRLGSRALLVRCTEVVVVESVRKHLASRLGIGSVVHGCLA